MSEFYVKVVRLGEIKKHPNADTLSIANIHGGYPCIIRSGDFAEGDLAVYIPVDAMVPVTNPKFSFLAAKSENGFVRIRASRLRGMFSMGLLVPIEPGMQEGDDVREALGVEKYAPPEDKQVGADAEPDPGYCVTYDIEGFRRFTDLFIPGEEVYITEKIHGTSARYLYEGSRLFISSRTEYKKPGSNNEWVKVADKYNLATKLKDFPGLAVYGEVYGQTKGFPYGADKKSPNFAAFDIFDIKAGKFLDVDDFLTMIKKMGIPTVPHLYRGPWDPALTSMVDGKSTLDGTHIREGIVIKPVKERFNEKIGRTILKLHSEEFLLKH